jgi:hypothetical protein
VVGAAILALAIGGALHGRHPRERAGGLRGHPPRPAASCAVGDLERAGVRIRGEEGSARVARSALERLLATAAGARAREILRSGALRESLTIELNARGDNLTRYRVPGGALGETIDFDPSALPLVETDQGPLAATPETVLAHELGHAVFKLRSEEAVIDEVENPVRRELGLPPRLRF